jgi:hypothetical protein
MTRPTMKGLLAVLPLAAALATGGCLQKETSHSLYLSRDGAVAWVAMEKDVHSDEADPAARRSEEQAYLALASAGAHGVGMGLAVLDPIDQRTTVLRATRPFTVRTEARYIRIDKLFERMLYELRLPGDATLARSGDKTTLSIRVDIGAAMADDGDRESPITGLAEGFSAYHLILTEGRFVAASGFTLGDDGMSATPAEVSELDVAADGGVIELSLTWK